MSSVGSSDGSNRQDEVVRRNREDYRNNETEMIKKHKAELRRISEQHYEEIENLKQEHAKQMEAIHKESGDTISARDHKYQKSMDDIREIHTKQLKKNAEENGRREEALRRAVKGDAEQSKNQNDTRFEKLSKDYRDNLLKAEATHQEATKEGREAQEKAISENRAKLEGAYQKQNDALRDERNEKVKQLDNQLNSYREYSEDRNRTQELRHMKDRERAGGNLMRSVGNERQARMDNEQILREGFQDGLNTQKERYEKAMKAERKALQMSQEDLKSTVNGRMDNQVYRLKEETLDLREQNNRDRLLSQHETKREIAAIRDSYGKNIENAMDQRDEAVRAANSQTAKDVARVRDDLTKQQTQSERFYRGRMAEQNRISRQAYDNLVDNFESDKMNGKQLADQRVEHIYNEAEDEKQRMIQMQQDTHAASQLQMRDQVREARELADNEKQIAVRAMQDRMRKQEMQHSDRMNQTISKYEKQIKVLEDQVLKERKNGEENLKRTVDELQRAHKTSVDQLESKNREQVRQLSSMQSEELRTLNRRHEEKIDAVLAEVKKT